eukprot:gnl/TRDRNA2_/TRDRNA2_176616_c4_seq2.p2 gnl/TRDRNA2_/TRDRNA2_176616_c4~~gnl/TRDRNA2_/TRDRNA2_176616_c4_seq2.p2  ORF type:complete len:119 (+),score=10.52 gnl/TRDRNA2_/TRDRNA2_176616_c4_seq2:195-551(+)
MWSPVCTGYGKMLAAALPHFHTSMGKAYRNGCVEALYLPLYASCTTAFAAERLTVMSPSSRRAATAVLACWSPFSASCTKALTAASLMRHDPSSRHVATAAMACRSPFHASCTTACLD